MTTRKTVPVSLKPRLGESGNGWIDSVSQGT